MRRPTRRATTRRPARPTTPFRLEVIHRDVYEIADGELATNFRRALERGDTEILSDLLDYVDALDGGPTETTVLDCGEVRQAATKGRL